MSVINKIKITFIIKVPTINILKKVRILFIEELESELTDNQFLISLSIMYRIEYFITYKIWKKLIDPNLINKFLLNEI